jgi:hypothetical protein
VPFFTSRHLPRGVLSRLCTSTKCPLLLYTGTQGLTQRLSVLPVCMCVFFLSSQVWTLTNSKNDGLKSALIAANEHLSSTPALLLFSGQPGTVSVLCRDGSVVLYTVNEGGRLSHVALDTSLQSKVKFNCPHPRFFLPTQTRTSAAVVHGLRLTHSLILIHLKVRDGGGVCDAHSTALGVMVRFGGLPSLGRITCQVGSAASLEHGAVDSAAPVSRRGGNVVVHPLGTVAVTWWPLAEVNLQKVENIVVSEIATAPHFTSRVSDPLYSCWRWAAEWLGGCEVCGVMSKWVEVLLVCTHTHTVTHTHTHAHTHTHTHTC